MRIRSLVVFLMAIGVMLVAGAAFLHKMIDFAFTMADDEMAGFGVVAVATYLLGMLPLLFLTLWAVMTGRFRDVERPATRMLELDARIERGGELGHG